MTAGGRRDDDVNLTDWRLGALEAGQLKLAEALSELVAQARAAKYIVLIIQPVLVALLVYVFTKG